MQGRLYCVSTQVSFILPPLEMLTSLLPGAATLRHGAWYDLDRLGVGGEGVDAQVGVGVAQDEAVFIGLAEDVG